MGKITGFETIEQIPSKVLLVYGAVQDLVGEGRDINDISVANITERAGIGKGTIYDYFDSREELIACAFLFYLGQTGERVTEAVNGYDCFEEAVRALFDRIDKDNQHKACFVRFIHGATDNSKYSPVIREKLSSSEIGKRLPRELFGKVVQMGIDTGEIREGMSVEYVIYMIFCKVLTYSMCVSTQACFDLDISKMREMVIKSILLELKQDL